MYINEIFVCKAMYSLEVLAKTTNKTVTEIMEPQKQVLQDMIPPKKHLLRHQPANAQIGLMDGNTFCTTLDPRLFTIDLSVVEHNVFFQEVSILWLLFSLTLSTISIFKGLFHLLFWIQLMKFVGVKGLTSPSISCWTTVYMLSIRQRS